MPSGGDITEITYNHPDLGSGVLFPKAAEDSTYDLGGFRASDDANSIDGGGNMIDQINRVRPSFEVLISWDMNDKQELEKLNAMSASPVLADWTFTNINGIVYGMKGKPVGDLQGNGNASTTTLKISGSGVMNIV